MAVAGLRDLSGRTPEQIESAVHETRKRCKELRALARLSREPLGDEFGPFDDLVRAAAGELSSIRDAHAVLATLDELAAAQGRGADLVQVRAGQARLADEATGALRGGDHRLTRATAALLEARDRLDEWAFDDDDWLAGAIGGTYRRCRRAHRRAVRRPTDERVHRWRTAVKRLWYQVRVVEAAAPSVLTPLVANLDALGEALGDDHDLAVLVERLEEDPERFGGAEAAGTAELIAREQQRELRRGAFRLGASLFAETAPAFAARIGTYWRRAKRLGPELPTGGIAELVADERERTRDRSPVERERKFVVDRLPPLPGGGTSFRQGYLAIDGTVSVRVRHAAHEGRTMTVKAGHGAVRTELEWALTPEQFEAAWPHTDGRRIDKTRHRLPLPDGSVEVDVFHGELDGLVVAEVEFDTEEALDAFRPPDWFGREVTDDPAYTNAVLATQGAPAPPG
ncbi:MAG: CHAD domain-containing protein [Ilumatobacter sp.]|uniref:CHAD domain-containing protein n=1 Tax=Ilumatobacter sp. TaxID=1967498 RepID=UPI002610E377|nr:CHAD domain-containing protein [Ilumatobacter sp.]MDJ0770378.1 CHAD domain-containing protein [Ilumatobacter sp.]